MADIARAAPSSFHLSQHLRNRFAVRANDEHTIEDIVENPHYLWHGYRRFQKGDIVEIDHPGAKFWIELYITKIDEDAKAVFFHIIDAIDFTEAAVATVDLSTATVERKGKKWAVIHEGSIMANNFDSEEEARTWLRHKAATLPQPQPQKAAA